MEDNLKITIRIADLQPMMLNIPRVEEQANRTAEYNVNKLYVAWCERFKDKTPNEIMGMVAFRFAKLYQDLSDQINKTDEVLEKFEDALNDLLLETQGLKNEE